MSDLCVYICEIGLAPFQDGFDLSRPAGVESYLSGYRLPGSCRQLKPFPHLLPESASTSFLARFILQRSDWLLRGFAITSRFKGGAAVITVVVEGERGGGVE